MSTGDDLVRRFRVMAVDGLPAPHVLWKCRWAALHERLTGEHGDDAEGCRRAFAAFIDQLGPERIAECPKHGPKWRLAAEIAASLVVSDRSPSPDEIERALNAAGADNDTWWAVDSFFDGEPIFLSGDRLGNGQHRACALKVSGAAVCPVAD